MAGFTLVELMIAATVFVFLIGAVIGLQIFGLRMCQMAKTTMIASTSARQTMNHIRDQIRSGAIVKVGTYSNAQFSAIADGLPQIGNAVQICLNTNQPQYTVLYQNPAGTNICLVANHVETVLANSVTNNDCFQAEDFQGTVNTCFMFNPVIRIKMDFVQWKYPDARYANGAAYDYYCFQTCVNRRPTQ
jgi:type II secretory pathway pseudopilin PulG